MSVVEMGENVSIVSIVVALVVGVVLLGVVERGCMISEHQRDAELGAAKAKAAEACAASSKSAAECEALLRSLP